jgi:topoisomerase-4 subunit A
MIMFKLGELPEMGRGKGVRIQKFKDGGISDLKTFVRTEGLSWIDSSGRTFLKGVAELADWLGERAQAGRQAPQGFPRNNRFGG